MTTVTLVVRVRNRKFIGPDSNQITLFTPEGAPGKCDEFELVTRGANFLEVRWTPPSEPNGLLLGYELIYSSTERARTLPVARNLTFTDPRQAFERHTPHAEHDLQS